MDNIDRLIIKNLCENGNFNNNEIAKKLNVSEGTIRNRIKKLLAEGNFKISGQLDSGHIKERQLIFIGVKVAANRELTVISEKIALIDDVVGVHITTGRYDMIVEIWVDINQGLINFLDNNLNKIDGILSTESFMAMRSINRWIAKPLKIEE